MPPKIASVPIVPQPPPEKIAATQQAMLLLVEAIKNQPERKPVEKPAWWPQNYKPNAGSAGVIGGGATDMQAFNAGAPSVGGAWANQAPLILPDKLREILAAQFPGVDLRPPEEFDDDCYMMPPLAVAQAVFAERRWLRLTDRNVFYWPQVYDCDDFAYALKASFSIAHFENASVQDPNAGIAAGIMLLGDNSVGRHLLNCVVTSDQGVWAFDATPTSLSQCPASQLGLPARYIMI